MGVGRAYVPLYLVKYSDNDGLIMTQLTKLQSYQVLHLLYVGCSVALSLVSLELPQYRGLEACGGCQVKCEAEHSRFGSIPINGLLYFWIS